ncbi:MAG TPA: PqqD family protein [Longimicrobiales bacterium]|nr:PqqD family protein [Longimicrobiales bacterium]
MGNVRGFFMPNREDVAAKVIDGELIIIRLSDGTYYSMENVGTRIWELIEARHDVATLAQMISTWYGTAVEHVESDVDALVQELLAERLIVGAESDGPAPSEPAPPDGGVTYEKPCLNIYRDMGNLLALDPPTPGIDDLLFRDGNAG